MKCPRQACGQHPHASILFRFPARPGGRGIATWNIEPGRVKPLRELAVAFATRAGEHPAILAIRNLRWKGTEFVCGHNISMDNAEINIASSKDGALVCLYGRIDIDSSPAVREQLLALLNTPRAKAVTIDLSAITHIDSSGLATLIEAVKIARGHKTEIKLQGLHDRLRTFFEVTGILALFNGTSNTAQQGKAV